MNTLKEIEYFLIGREENMYVSTFYRELKFCLKDAYKRNSESPFMEWGKLFGDKTMMQIFREEESQDYIEIMFYDSFDYKELLVEFRLPLDTFKEECMPKTTTSTAFTIEANGLSDDNIKDIEHLLKELIRGYNDIAFEPLGGGSEVHIETMEIQI